MDTTTELTAVWQTLTHRQRDFVTAMRSAPTKAAAAAAIGVNVQTVYRWPDTVDEAIRLDAAARLGAEMDVLRAAVAVAAELKVSEMHSTDERVAARARTEILDRVLGKPTARVDAKVTTEYEVTPEMMNSVLDDLDARLARSLDAEA